MSAVQLAPILAIIFLLVTCLLFYAFRTVRGVQRGQNDEMTSIRESGSPTGGRSRIERPTSDDRSRRQKPHTGPSAIQDQLDRPDEPSHDSDDDDHFDDQKGSYNSGEIYDDADESALVELAATSAEGVLGSDRDPSRDASDRVGPDRHTTPISHSARDADPVDQPDGSDRFDPGNSVAAGRELPIAHEATTASPDRRHEHTQAVDLVKPAPRGDRPRGRGKRDDVTQRRKATLQSSLVLTDAVGLTFGARSRGEHGGNQDFYLISDRLVGVADGVGGLERGDTASALALSTIAARRPQEAQDTAVALVDAVLAANRAVRAYARRLVASPGMATTADVVIFDVEGHPPTMAYAHVGDGTIWHCPSSGTPRALTDPHAIPNGPLLLALGREDDLAPDRGRLPIMAGDRIVISTDGLTSAVSHKEIISELAHCTSLTAQEAASRLVEAAVAAGTRDDTTVVVIDVESVVHRPVNRPA